MYTILIRLKSAGGKIGYPEYFAKILNACDFIGIHLNINNELIDLNELKVENFTRVLDMKNGDLTREADITLSDNSKIHIKSQRFVSMAEREIGAIKYSITPLTNDVHIHLNSCVNGDVRNTDANYDEMFWNEEDVFTEGNLSGVTLSTKKTNFLVSSVCKSLAFINDSELSGTANISNLSACTSFDADVKLNETFTLYKYFAVTTNRDYKNDQVTKRAVSAVTSACEKRL